MKKKVLLITLLLVFGLLLLGACASNDTPAATPAPADTPADDTPSDTPAIDAGDRELLIYGIYKAGDQTWFIDEGEASQRVVENAGGTFVFVDARMDPEENMNAIENAIANNADGILLCIVDQLMSQSVVDRLADAGIPVVAVDDPLIDEHGTKIAPWVGIDAYVIGYGSGEWMAYWAIENGFDAGDDVGVLILTIDTVSSVVPRSEGQFDAFTSRLPDFPLDRIFHGDYLGAVAEGFDVANTIFVANPHITRWIVMAPNDEGAVGALRALEQAGLAEDSGVMGLGAYLAKDEWNQHGSDSGMVAAAFFSAEAIGTIAAEMLLNYILHGTPMVPETAVPAIIVTPYNYREIMGAAAD